MTSTEATFHIGGSSACRRGRRWDAPWQQPCCLSIPWRYLCSELSVSRDSSGAVSYLPYTLLASAVCATVYSSICLYAMTEDSAATMATGGGKGLNSTLKAVKGI
jgi:hypothetical protein